MAERLNKLTQRIGWRHSQTLEIVGEELRCETCLKGDTYSCKIALKAMDENHMEGSFRKEAWGIAAAVCLIVGLPIATWAVANEVKSADSELLILNLIVAAVFLVPGLILICLYVRSIAHYAWIYARNGDGRLLLALRTDRPTREQVAAFLEVLLAEAKRFSRESEEQPASSQDGIAVASEIRKFYALSKDGLLTQEEFEAKKAALLEEFVRR